MKQWRLAALGLLASLLAAPAGWALEPKLIDYTSYPEFTVNPVKPNIMIILDNSGSMNENAYGTYPNGGLVTDQPYAGAPYKFELSYKVGASADDAEEFANGTTTTNNNSGDLDMGRFDASSTSTIGLRFQNLQIPKGATITKAYIAFTSSRDHLGSDSNPISLTIFGEDVDNAVVFANTSYNVSSRTETDAKVVWSSSEPWDQFDTRNTPDLKGVVQEIVSRQGWKLGNAMAFKIRYETVDPAAKRDPYSYEVSNAAYRPTLFITYTMPELGTLYYGYFNPEWFYMYGSNKFDHAYKKVSYDDDNKCWNVIKPTSFTKPGEESTWDKSCLTDANINSNKLWDGNWMNWAAMRKIDVARKVILGGLATSRTGGGNTTNLCETSLEGRVYRRNFATTTGSAVTPYSPYVSGWRSYGFQDGKIYVDTDNDNDPFDNKGSSNFSLEVKKNILFDARDFEETSGNLAGVMQRFADQALWGNMFFNYGTGKNEEGAEVENAIGSNMTNMITTMQNRVANTWTPLAESYYVAMQYFKQENPQAGLGYANGVIGPINDQWDPFKRNKKTIECAKSFVLLITDGASTKDAKIPTALKSYDPDKKDWTGCDESGAASTCEYPSHGSDFLDDVALYARTVDLRTDIIGDQNLILYPVYAFGTDANARQLLRDAARNGGFEDKNGDLIPNGDYSASADQRLEWDKDGDGDPDTYFEAQEGYAMEEQLGKAISDILQRASSGTAVSVLSTSDEGEGNVVQAYFKPTVTNEGNEVKWTGNLQSLWLDGKGNLREDTNANFTLDLNEDRIIKYATDSTGNTQVRKYDVDKIVCRSTSSQWTDAQACAGVTGTTTGRFNMDRCKCEEDIYPDIIVTCNSTVTGTPTSTACAGVSGESAGYYNDGACSCTDNADDTGTLADVKPLWEAGKALARVSDPDDLLSGRKIFSLLDDSTAPKDLFGGTALTTANVSYYKPYFGIKDAATWDYLGVYNTTTGIDVNSRARNLIRFIRGFDDGYLGETRIRRRALPVDGANRVWRLGDIVHSTPVTVAQPASEYDLLYRDRTYQDFLLKYKDRETVVYVGANDGMLHAFTSWQYDKDQMKYVPPAANTVNPKAIGDELWAYVPRTLLPHLKWLPKVDYTHVYYVDLKPKVVDARIFFDSAGKAINAAHPNGWGTVLVGGLRMGGKAIGVTDDFDRDSATADTSKTFEPVLFAIDITEPRNPKVLWERTYKGMGLTTSQPNLIKIGDQWRLIVGSGPETYAGTSTQKAKFYVIDLATGAPLGDAAGQEWLFEFPEQKAFMGGPSSVDYGLNYNVDAIYIGQTYDSSPDTKPPTPPAWKGSLYRIGIPWGCSGTGDCSNPAKWPAYGHLSATKDCTCSYNTAQTTWKAGKLFESPGPITIEPSLSRDRSNNVWIYFGSGRYLGQADRATREKDYLYGIKDPFFNTKHSTAGNDANYNYLPGISGANNYYHDVSKTLTLRPFDFSGPMADRLFKADQVTIVYPWGIYEAPAGDCSAVPTGQVGDIYGDNSCVGSYAWPLSQCVSDIVGDDDAVACASIPDGQLGDIDIVADPAYKCSCSPYPIPTWGCIDKVSGGCDAVHEGVVADTSTYQSMYWQRKNLDPEVDGCAGVPFGEVVDNAQCVTSIITPPAWTVKERPAGDCSTVVPPLAYGMEGEFNQGSCRAGYWACSEATDGGCDSVDYTQTTGFLGVNGDGDINGDGSCLCKFTDDPVAKAYVAGSTATMTFTEIVDEARTWEGWYRSLVDPGERLVQKPAIIGGVALYPSYVPDDDDCAFGGKSYFYGLYYETGTPYTRDIFDITVTVEDLAVAMFARSRILLGQGMATTPGVHVGNQDNNEVTTLIGRGDGSVDNVTIEPPFKVRSGLQYWQQR